VLPGFLRAYPSVSVEILLTNEVLSFREQNIDVALRLAARLPDSSLVARKLLAIEPILVASPTYLAERGTPSEPSDLAAHDHLAVPVPTSRPPMFEKEEGGDVRTVELRGRVLTHDDHLLRDLAVAGCGITAVIPQFARDDLESGRLVRVLPDWKLTYSANLYLIYASGVLAPKTRAFRDFMFAFLAGDDCP
jgi:DNA-binding transcriptional LysR family regulator